MRLASLARVYDSGMPDDRASRAGPESLQAPWRLAYLENEDKRERDARASGAGSGSVPASGAADPDGSGSFLLDYWNAPERDGPNHVIVRVPNAGGQAGWEGPGGLILLNKYPYSNGHLLVALGVARGRLLDYSPIERAAFWRLVDVAADLMERTLQPQGINFGVNQGRAGGAGVPQHLHAHLVPRWAGDVNYMTTIGNVRVSPASLEAMAERYRRVWRA